MNIDLIKELRGLKQLEVGTAFQENAKRRLFQRIQKQDIWLVRLLKEILKPLPDTAFVMQAKMRLFENIAAAESIHQTIFEKTYDVVFHILQPRRFIASGIAFALVLLTVSVPFTQASVHTQLFIQNGVVKIKSLGGDWEIANDKRDMRIGDQIKTLAGGSAEIHFPDYSVIRIAENTSLSLTQFTTNIQNSASTVLKLQEGRVWSNVALQKQNQNFFVETRDSRVFTDFGIFDVKANGHTRIKTLLNTTRVEPRFIVDTQEILLSAGFQTDVSTTSIETQVFQGVDAWGQQNQEKDIQLQVSLREIETAKIKKMAGMLPTNPLYGMDQVLMNVTNNAFKQVEEKFAESKVLYSLQEFELSQNMFDMAKQQLAELWSDESSHEEILALLNTEKAFFLHVLPNDELYPLKKQFQSLLVTYANNPQQELLQQTSDRMLEIQSIAVNSKLKDQVLVASMKEFTDYNNSIVTSALENGDGNELEQLLNLQTENLKTLQELTDADVNISLKKETKILKKDLVETIEKIVSQIAPERSKKYALNVNQADWFVSQIQTMVNRVNVYQSERGRMNTITLILKNIENKEENLALLYTLKGAMPADVSFVISKKILDIRQEARN